MPSVGGEKKVRALLGLWAVLCLGCGAQEPTFDGSLTDILPLDYDASRLEVSKELFALRFLKARGEGEDLVLKVAVITSGLTLAAGEEIDLAEALPTGAQRGLVTRNVFEDPHQKFPKIQRGAVLLKGDPLEAGKVKGELAITFEQGHEFGAGRTLYGPFVAEVVR